jgi:hypothetical protein
MTGIDHQGRYRQGKLRCMVAGLSGQNRYFTEGKYHGNKDRKST